MDKLSFSSFTTSDIDKSIVNSLNVRFIVVD